MVILHHQHIYYKATKAYQAQLKRASYHLLKLNLDEQSNNHSSQPPKLHPINFYKLNSRMVPKMECIYYFNLMSLILVQVTVASKSTHFSFKIMVACNYDLPLHPTRRQLQTTVSQHANYAAALPTLIMANRVVFEIGEEDCRLEIVVIATSS